MIGTPIPVLNSFASASQTVQTSQLPGIKLQRPFPVTPPAPNPLTDCSLFGSVSKKLNNSIVDYGVSSDEEQPIATVFEKHQRADMRLPETFDSLLKEATKVAGISSLDLVPEPLPDGSHILRLPSNPPEIQKHYESMDISMTTGTAIVPSRYPLQPQYVHRTHTASHVSHPREGGVATPRLSSVPMELAPLRMEGQAQAHSPIVSWPLPVAKEVELSVQHVLDTNYHQDLLQTVSLNSMHEILDQVTLMRDNNTLPSPDILNNLMTNIGLCLASLTSAIELNNPAYQHLTFAHASLELARRHRLLHITRFKPSVSKEDIAALHLSSLGSTNLVSARVCKGIRHTVSQQDKIINNPFTPASTSRKDIVSTTPPPEVQSDTDSMGDKSDVSSIDISSAQQQLLTQEKEILTQQKEQVTDIPSSSNFNDPPPVIPNVGLVHPSAQAGEDTLSTAQVTQEGNLLSDK